MNKLIAGVGLALIASAACSDNGNSESDSAAKLDGSARSDGRGEVDANAKSCSAICDRAVQCDSSTNRDICIADCERSLLTLQAKFNEATAACSEKPCAEGAACVLDAQKQCTALATAQSVVELYCAKKKSCDAATDLTACAAQTGPTLECFSQAGLDKMSGCIRDAGCDKVDEAIARCMQS